MRWNSLTFLFVAGFFCPFAISLLSAAEPITTDPAGTSTEWRNDVANLEAVRKMNASYERMPFSREFEGVLDDPPFRLDWQVGPNTPLTWKGGVAGLIGDEIILTGGLWMPPRANLTYAYHVKKRTYRPLPAPPIRPQYTQGACDGKAIYVVGGRGIGRHVYKFSPDENDNWHWDELAQLPEAEGKGRWLSSASMIAGKWLFLVSGHPTGTPSEKRDKPPLPDYRLRLNVPNARWEKMAPYPGGHRALIQSATVRGKLYVFGGSHPEPLMRKHHVDLAKKFKLRVPYNGVPNYRDAYSYNPKTNSWQSVRRLPFPILAGFSIPFKDRYILLMGSADVPTFRVGKSQGRKDPFWTGYGDRILCYDVEKNNYSHIGVMLYGVATSHWVTDGKRFYSFGGEPAHLFNDNNTENVLQIGTIRRRGGR